MRITAAMVAAKVRQARDQSRKTRMTEPWVGLMQMESASRAAMASVSRVEEVWTGCLAGEVPRCCMR